MNSLSHIYSLIKSEIARFIFSNELPFGNIVVKITSNWHNSNILCVRLSVFDIHYCSFFTDYSFRANAITHITGKGLARSSLNTDEKFGLNLTHIFTNL